MPTNNQFTFKVFGRHYQHEDSYDVTFNEDGWYISHISISGQCDRTGEPSLYANFRQDDISFPEAIRSEMSSIWEFYHEGMITAEDVQKNFDLLGRWIDATGDARPQIITGME